LKGIDGYGMIYSCTSEKCRGVIIYYQEHISVSEYKFANSNFDEASWCMVNLENKETLLLGAVYRSPNSTDINTRNLLTLLDAFSDVRCNYKLIVGDFNFPNINWTDWTTPHGIIHREFLF